MDFTKYLGYDTVLSFYEMLLIGEIRYKVWEISLQFLLTSRESTNMLRQVLITNVFEGWSSWPTSETPALRRLRQEYSEFKASKER